MENLVNNKIESLFKKFSKKLWRKMKENHSFYNEKIEKKFNGILGEK